MSKSLSAYIPSIDGLRGISILMVFIAHIGFERIVPGGLGVTIFFFISGYLITTLLIDEFITHRDIDFKLFFTRRLLRLYPPLLFMLVLYGVYLIITRSNFYTAELWASLFYYENYHFFNQPLQSSPICKILWSLAVEEHFYLLFPPLFLILAKTPKFFVSALVMLLFIPLALRISGTMLYGNSGDVIERYTYCLTHTRFDSIMYGCLASLLLHLNISGSFAKVLADKRIFIIALVAIIGCLFYRNEFFRNTLRYSIQGLALFIIVPAIINVKTYQPLKSFLSSAVLVWIGRLSYAIYLTHMIAISALSFLREGGHTIVFYIAVTILTAILAVSCHYLIEKPFARLRKRFKPSYRLVVA
ncbi:acyltransferase [Mucilaginibacter sp. CSA2-8R]|uniref:acyltransferase family protein n=1 Tax=Mucilaginibacter sp. CSA2-8R TaxID=3141542 RepID=UPI00315D93BC